MAQAVRCSFLEDMRGELRTQLLADAIPLIVPAGGVVYRDAETPCSGLVLDGLIRVYLTSADGRQLTIRYARPGATIGLPTAVGGPLPINLQAVSDSTVLMFNTTTLRKLATKDAGLAWLLAQEVTGVLDAILEAFAGSAFGSVRERLARHLLDLSTERQRDGALVTEVNQQGLADAVGTAREVVARTLHDFRDDGFVASRHRRIVLLDPEGLDTVASNGGV